MIVKIMKWSLSGLTMITSWITLNLQLSFFHINDIKRLIIVKQESYRGAKIH